MEVVQLDWPPSSQLHLPDIDRHLLLAVLVRDMWLSSEFLRLFWEFCEVPSISLEKLADDGSWETGHTPPRYNL